MWITLQFLISVSCLIPSVLWNFTDILSVDLDTSERGSETVVGEIENGRLAKGN